MIWVFVFWILMCIIMLFGVCVGFIIGGIKCICIVIMSCVFKNEFKYIIYFNVIFFVCINC